MYHFQFKVLTYADIKEKIKAVYGADIPEERIAMVLSCLVEEGAEIAVATIFRQINLKDERER